MKLIIACLLAGASLSSLCVKGLNADATTASAKTTNANTATTGPQNDWCPAGTLDKITSIKIDKAGSHDFMNKCKVKGGISVTFDTTMAATDEDGAASTVTLKDSTIGARTLLLVKGVPDQEMAKSMVPLNINIQNNVFQTDGQIFVSGAFSPNSCITITGNKMTIARPLDGRYPWGKIMNTTASAITLGDVYLWSQAAVRIVDNEIKGKDSKGRFKLHGISIPNHMYYYGTNATLEIARNDINLQCAPHLMNQTLWGNNTLCAYGLHSEHMMYMYVKDSKFVLHNNTFNVTGGLLFKMPNFLSHMASTRIIASDNKGYSYSEKNPTTCTVRRYNPFAEFSVLNLGAQTYLSIENNKFECKGKAGILGFATDFAATDYVFATIRGNEINTKGCSPSIYFMNTFALTQRAVLWITQNVNTRTDKLTSGLASVYFAGEFAVQHDAEMTISNNTFGKANTIKAKTKMVGLAPSAINSWKVEEQAAIHMCHNTYNGTFLEDEDDLKPHIALKMQEVVIVDECRNEPRPYSEDFEPGGAEDITQEAMEFEDASAQYTKAIIDDTKPQEDPENNLEDGDEVFTDVKKKAKDSTTGTKVAEEDNESNDDTTTSKKDKDGEDDDDDSTIRKKTKDDTPKVATASGVDSASAEL